VADPGIDGIYMQCIGGIMNGISWVHRDRYRLPRTEPGKTKTINHAQFIQEDMGGMNRP
jgi:hypothetical protein